MAVAELDVLIKTTQSGGDKLKDFVSSLKNVKTATLDTKIALLEASKNFDALSANAKKSGSALDALKAQRAANELKQLENAASLSNKAMLLVAGGVGVAAAAIAGIVVVTTKAAIAFQTATIDLSNQADLTVSAAKDISNAILDIGKNSEFSATEMIKALTPVAGRIEAVTGSALTAAQATQVLQASTDLADASMTDLKESTNAVVNVLLSYKKPLSDAAEVSDKLFNISRATGIGIGELATSVDRLNDKLGTSAPDLTDMGALLEELSHQGLSGSRGLLAVASAIDTLTSNSDEVNTTLHNMGVGVFDAQGKFIGLRNVIAELQPIFANLSDQQKNEAAQSLFGAGAAGVLLNVIEGGVGTWDTYAANVNKADTAQQAAARDAGTTGEQFDILKNHISASATAFGAQFIPAVDNALTVINFLISGTGELNDKLGGVPAKLASIASGIALLTAPWSSAWDGIKSVTETAVNFILDQITRMVRGLGQGIQAIRDSVSSIAGARTALDNIGLSAGVADALKNFSAGNVNFTGGGGASNEPRILGSREDRGTGTLPPASTQTGVVPGLPTSGGGGGGSAALTALGAAMDGVITRTEALTLGLTDQEVIALELAVAANKQADADFRRRIELQTLAQVFPGLTSQEVQFRLGLAAIADHLQQTGESIQQFILDTSTSALNGFKSAFDAIFNKPTKESAQLQLQLDEAKRKKLLNPGASDSQKKKFDADIQRIQDLINVRSNAVDILKDKATLADQTLLSDADALNQAGLTISAIGQESVRTAQAIGQVFLNTLAQMNGGSPAANSTLSLADALKALYALPDHGQSLLPSLDSGGTVLSSGIARVQAGERFYNRGSGPVGEAGITNNMQIYVTVGGDATERTVAMIKKAVRDEAEAALRSASFRGSYVTSGAYTPS